MFELRHYQQKAVDMLYDSFRNGNKRVIVWLATGGGKTATFSYITKEFLKYGKVVIIMSGRELVKQSSNALLRMEVSHSVYMAGDPRLDLSKKVQVCSIDTINARESYPFEGDSDVLVIYDESHMATPRSRKAREVFKRYEKAHIAGFTATPFSDNSLFDDIVNPISPMELMKEGYLVPIRTFIPNVIDVSKVRIKSTGDFDEKELFDVVSQKAVIGDVVNDWIQHGQNKRTLCFGVNIEHSKMLCEAFNVAGIKAEHIDGTTSNRKREEVFNRVRKGETTVLCNVGVLTTGFDLPAIECLSFARPTQSLILYLQIIGRVLRPSKETGKSSALILDNAGNILRFGSPYKNRKAVMGKSPMVKDPTDLTIRTCKKCFFVFPANENECPNCGFKNEPVKIDVKTMSGELQELFLSDEEIEQLKKSAFISDYYKLEFIRKSRGLWNKFTVDKLEKKYGKEDFERWIREIK